MTRRSNVHLLDYQPKDIAEAVEELRKLEQAGQLAGMMFVVKVKHRKRPLVGAAGCCVTDPVASLGAAGYMLGAVMDSTFND